MTDSYGPDRGIRHLQYLLFLFTAVLGIAGGLTESVWLMGLAAWALIGAGLIEMIYRP